MTQTASTAPARTPQASVDLEELYQRGDYYGLLNIAVPHLARNPDDTASALVACRAYVILGLIGPARELLAKPPAT